MKICISIQKKKKKSGIDVRKRKKQNPKTKPPKKYKHYLCDEELKGRSEKEILQYLFGHCNKLYETQCCHSKKKKKKF